MMDKQGIFGEWENSLIAQKSDRIENFKNGGEKVKNIGTQQILSNLKP
jgi:hypothetical protein